MRKLLPPLYNGDFSAECAHILDSVCRVDADVTFGPLPARASEFSLFRPCRMIKRGQDGKEKSTRGHVWVDSDPVAILFNKYRIRSCHTLDNKEHEYYTGNFTHLYNPYMSCVFAGKDHETMRSAVSPISGGQACFRDGCNVMIRDHQAVANLYLMRDVSQRPYVLLSRLYQSTAENPWDATILRYVYNRCKRFGLGMALGDTWCEWQVNQNTTIGVSAAFPDYTSIYLRTPMYALPVGKDFFEAYDDDDLEYKVHRSEHWRQCSACRILKPVIDGTFPNADFEPYGSTPSALYLGEAEDNRASCCNCGNRLDEDDENYSSVTDRTYCNSCYGELFTYCSVCESDIYRRDVVTNTDYEPFCSSCYDGRYTTCDNCSCEVALDDVIEVDGDSYCMECAGNLSKCDACNSVTTDDMTTVTNESDGATSEVCSSCADDTVRCVNCDRLFLPVTERFAVSLDHQETHIVSGSHDRYARRYTCNACCAERIWIYRVDSQLQPSLTFA